MSTRKEILKVGLNGMDRVDDITQIFRTLLMTYRDSKELPLEIVVTVEKARILTDE